MVGHGVYVANSIGHGGQLGVGIMRLVLFSLIFVLIIQADLGTAITSGDKRAVSDLLTDSLGLEDFTSITRLAVLREYLPELSSRSSWHFVIECMTMRFWQLCRI